MWCAPDCCDPARVPDTHPDRRRLRRMLRRAQRAEDITEMLDLCAEVDRAIRTP